MRRLVALLIVLAMVLLPACGQEDRWQEQYELGRKYLSDGDYEEAILAFTLAIEIDPEQPKAYLYRGDAYMMAALDAMENGDYDEAEDYLDMADDDYDRAEDLDYDEDKIDDRREELEELDARLQEQEPFEEAELPITEALPEHEDSGPESDTQTLWLQTSLTTIQAKTSRTTTSWTYDKQGRLVQYGYETTDFREEATGAGYEYVYDYTYDVAGNLQQVAVGSEATSLVYEAVYENGLLAQYRVEEIEGDAAIAFVYDAQGRVISKEQHLDGSMQVMAEITYHPNGQIARIRSGDYYTYIEEFDEQGKQISAVTYDSEGVFLFKTVSSYDSEGRVSCVSSYSMDEAKPISITRYAYDDEEHICTVSGENNGQKFYCEGWWDPAVRRMTFEDWMGQRVVVEYDRAGNCICMTTYQGEEMVTRQEYTYIALELPLDYEKPNLNDPRYLLN